MTVGVLRKVSTLAAFASAVFSVEKSSVVLVQGGRGGGNPPPILDTIQSNFH